MVGRRIYDQEFVRWITGHGTAAQWFWATCWHPAASTPTCSLLYGVVKPGTCRAPCPPRLVGLQLRRQLAGRACAGRRPSVRWPPPASTSATRSPSDFYFRWAACACSTRCSCGDWGRGGATSGPASSAPCIARCSSVFSGSAPCVATWVVQPVRGCEFDARQVRTHCRSRRRHIKSVASRRQPAARRSLTCFVAIIIAVFIVCWLPYWCFQVRVQRLHCIALVTTGLAARRSGSVVIKEV